MIALAVNKAATMSLRLPKSDCTLFLAAMNMNSAPANNAYQDACAGLSVLGASKATAMSAVHCSCDYARFLAATTINSALRKKACQDRFGMRESGFQRTFLG